MTILPNGNVGIGSSKPSNWSDFLQPVLVAYNNTKHFSRRSSTKWCKSEWNTNSHETEEQSKDRQVSRCKWMEIVRESKWYTRHLRVSSNNWIHNYIQFKKDYHNGVYKVDGDMYPRKEIQLVKVDVIQLPEKIKQQQAIINKMDKIGKAANNLHVKQQFNNPWTPRHLTVKRLNQWWIPGNLQELKKW